MTPQHLVRLPKSKEHVFSAWNSRAVNQRGETFLYGFDNQLMLLYFTLELGKNTGVSLYGYSYSLEPKRTVFARFGLNGTPAQSFVALMSKSHGRGPWDFDIRAAKDSRGYPVMPYVAHLGQKAISRLMHGDQCFSLILRAI